MRLHELLNDGGETGELIRNYNWSASLLGKPDYWPQNLRVTVSTMLRSPVPMFLFWGHEHIFFYNDAFRPGLGENGTHPAIGKTGKEVWQNRWENMKPLIDNILTKSSTAVMQNQLLQVHGRDTAEDVWWACNYSLVVNEKGNAEGVLAICNETQAVSIKKLEEADTKTKLAIECANLGQYEINLLTDEMVTSARFMTIWGADHRRMPRSEFAAFIHPDDRSRREQAHKEALVSGKLFYETRIIWKDKTVHWIRVDGKVLYDKDGTATTLLGVIQDITEQKIIQQRKDNFIAMASHELKTPLTSIKAYAQIIGIMLSKRGAVEESQMIDKIDNQINNLNRLVADLLNISKIDTGRLEHERNYFNLNECITQVAEELQRTTAHHTMQISLDKPVTVFADRNRIGQVITNFISNAIKYSPDGEVINMKTQITMQEVIFSVQDFGIGIGKEDQELIFEKFYRVNNARHQSFTGMGLGLYICAVIIKREGGKLWVESDEDKGSTFYFSLPLMKSD